MALINSGSEDTSYLSLITCVSFLCLLSKSSETPSLTQADYGLPPAVVAVGVGAVSTSAE
jgi:hypothetical protein